VSIFELFLIKDAIIITQWFIYIYTYITGKLDYLLQYYILNKCSFILGNILERQMYIVIQRFLWNYLLRKKIISNVKQYTIRVIIYNVCDNRTKNNRGLI